MTFIKYCTACDKPSMSMQCIDGCTGNCHQTVGDFDLGPNFCYDFSLRLSLSLIFGLKFGLIPGHRHEVKFGLKCSLTPNFGLRLLAKTSVVPELDRTHCHYTVVLFCNSYSASVIPRLSKYSARDTCC